MARRPRLPDFRCSALLATKGKSCGRRAGWVHQAPEHYACPLFYCRGHKPKGARVLTRDHHHWTVSIAAVVVLTGSGDWQDFAAGEAIGRARRAIQAAGGVLSVLEVVCHEGGKRRATGSPLRLQLAGDGYAATDDSQDVLEASGVDRRQFGHRRRRA